MFSKQIYLLLQNLIKEEDIFKLHTHTYISMSSSIFLIFKTKLTVLVSLSSNSLQQCFSFIQNITDWSAVLAGPTPSINSWEKANPV